MNMEKPTEKKHILENLEHLKASQSHLSLKLLQPQELRILDLFDPGGACFATSGFVNLKMGAITQRNKNTTHRKIIGKS